MGKPPVNPPPGTLVVGDVVDYWPAQGRADDFAYFDATQPCMATIVYVNPDGTFNLRVLDQYGKPYAETEVNLAQPKVGGELPRDQHYVSLRDVDLSTRDLKALQRELDRKAKKLHLP